MSDVAGREQKHLVVDRQMNNLLFKVCALENLIARMQHGDDQKPPGLKGIGGMDKPPNPSWGEVYNSLPSRVQDAEARLDKVLAALQEMIF